MKKLFSVLLALSLALSLSACATQDDVDKAYDNGYEAGYSDGWDDGYSVCENENYKASSYYDDPDQDYFEGYDDGFACAIEITGNGDLWEEAYFEGYERASELIYADAADEFNRAFYNFLKEHGLDSDYGLEYYK